MIVEELHHDLLNLEKSSITLRANSDPEAYKEFSEKLDGCLSSTEVSWEIYEKLISYSALVSIVHGDLEFSKKLIEKFGLLRKDTEVNWHILARFFHAVGDIYQSYQYFSKLYDSNPDRLDILDFEKFLFVSTETGQFAVSEKILSEALVRYENVLVWKIKAYVHQITFSHLFEIDRETKINNFKYLYARITKPHECAVLASAAYHLGQFDDYVGLMNHAFERMTAIKPKGKKSKPFVADECLETATEISNLLTAYGKEPFFVFGSLLGLYRDGKLMDYDKDADIGLFVSGLEEVHAIAKRLCEKNEHFVAPGIVKNSFDKHRLNLAIFDLKRGTAVDLFFFYPRGDQVYTGIHTECGPLEWVFSSFKIDTLKISDRVYPIPKNPEVFLEEAYGSDWRVPIEVWDSTVDCPNLSEQSKKACTMYAAGRMFEALSEGKLQKAKHYFKNLEEKLEFPFTEAAKKNISTKLEGHTKC